MLIYPLKEMLQKLKLKEFLLVTPMDYMEETIILIILVKLILYLFVMEELKLEKEMKLTDLP